MDGGLGARTSLSSVAWVEEQVGVPMGSHSLWTTCWQGGGTHAAPRVVPGPTVRPIEGVHLCMEVRVLSFEIPLMDQGLVMHLMREIRQQARHLFASLLDQPQLVLVALCFSHSVAVL